MNEFEFTLKFSLFDASVNPEVYIEQLAEAGCDDAIVGIGQEGAIALEFNREAETALDAIVSAIEDVKSVIPDARLIESTPDLVGLTDIAKILDFSRQNIRKLMLSHKATFPAPVHAGNPSIWHLNNVLNWFENVQSRYVEPPVKEVSHATMQVNIVKESQSLDKADLTKLTAISL
jgi:hypothetical protein